MSCSYRPPDQSHAPCNRACLRRIGARPWPWVLNPNAFIFTLALAAAGCQRKLMPTPLLFQARPISAFADVAPVNRTTRATVLFATDRQRHPDGRRYNAKRTAGLVLGRCTVQMGEEDEIDWPSLARQSCLDRADRDDLPVSITETLEITPLQKATYSIFDLAADAPTSLTPPDDKALDAKQTTTATSQLVPEDSRHSSLPSPLPEYEFAQILNDQLAQSRSAEIFVYVHGYNNSFEKAVCIAGELWHFLQRRGAVVAYCWPARTDLFGYIHDRESAEYTSGHFREFLLFLARDTDAQRIHIICHSTGAAVVGTALRELRLIYYWRPIEHVRRLLKLGHLVLVAPDIDLALFKARCFGEGLHLLPQSMTIYASPQDKALNFARKVLYGLTRVGTLAPQNLTADDIKILLKYPQVQIVNIAGQRNLDFFGHSHHTSNPSVSSDLILLLTRDLQPSDRGLVRVSDLPLWSFPQDYRKRIQQIAREQFPPVASPEPPG